MKILWGRILIIGFGFEILSLLILNVVVIGWLQYAPTDLELSIALFIGFILCGLWIGKMAQSKEILHGTLVGVASVLIYVLIALASKHSVEYNFVYFLLHIVKILGGMLGGFLALKLANRQIETYQH